MKLYHGTDGRFLDHILKTGVRPRGINGRNNWKHVPHQSNPKCVYLSDSYAPYFAFNAARGNTPLCAVVEIETDCLHEDDLYPDEDCLEQIGRAVGDGVPGDMSQRTLHYRKHQFSFHGLMKKNSEDLLDWRDSLRALGTCSHRGPIPPEAITRAVRWPHLPNVRLQWIWDPTISLLNQRILGDRYRLLTAKLFAGEFADPKTLSEEEISACRGTLIPPIQGFELIER
jgi:hypothetical protein